MVLGQFGTVQANGRCSLSACWVFMDLRRRTELGGEWAFSVLPPPLLSGFPLPTFHSRADRPSGDAGAEWDDVGACGYWVGMPGRAGQGWATCLDALVVQAWRLPATRGPVWFLEGRWAATQGCRQGGRDLLRLPYKGERWGQARRHGTELRAPMGSPELLWALVGRLAWKLAQVCSP